MTKRSDGKKKVRRPRGIENVAFFDFYWEQFSEPGDKPTITAIIEDDSFTITPKWPEKSKEELKRMKRIYSWLGRAIAYLEQKNGK
jgi:hypothetical protein